ncbi:hypothetical protein [Sorangium sp. So ce1099]|uniref:hypothetical protein n=1 Tax=Sorangium sp. So ce1099 TaxID=3133331 RepID=UPI003F6368DE
MSADDGAPDASSATLLECARCGRSFLLVPGPGIAAAPRCACGADLTPAPLPSGVHELRRPRAARARPPRRRAPPRREPPAQEADLGYGESHGYAPGHGGPTGPGDAPAPVRTAPEPSPERGGSGDGSDEEPADGEG